MHYGEIIQLGRHKLMCGDATRLDDVHALVGYEKINLVLTDPPYGMKCQDKYGAIAYKVNKGIKGAKEEHYKNAKLSSHQYPLMIGDNSQETGRKNYEIIKTFTDKLIIWGGQYFAQFLPVNGGWIFWNKVTGNNDFSDGELAYCSSGKRIRMYTQMWNGTFRAGKQKYELKRRVHPTQKPVELHMKIHEDFTQEGDCILDCFGGSGTTLIAAELTNRKCLMMEISPEYCEIIKRRYDELTQGKINFS